jgi:hypothetical protein
VEISLYNSFFQKQNTMAETKLTLESLHEIIKSQQATIDALNLRINGAPSEEPKGFVGTKSTELEGKVIEIDKKKYSFNKPNFRIEKSIYTGAEVLENPAILSTVVKGTKTTYLEVLVKNKVLSEVTK